MSESDDCFRVPFLQSYILWKIWFEEQLWISWPEYNEPNELNKFIFNRSASVIQRKFRSSYKFKLNDI